MTEPSVAMRFTHIEMEGGTTFHFIDASPAEALG
jgi:hypothetical protein